MGFGAVKLPAMQKLFELKAEAGALPLFRTQLRDLLIETGFTEKLSGEILVAVQEALTNVIRHAYGGKPEKIEIQLEDHPDRIEISIRDFGKPFDLDSVPEPELPPTKPGGLGVFLIKNLMDKVSYTPQGVKGNTLQLVKFKKEKLK